ncbi:IS66 family insertion sequence element accessory protein TnpB [Bathymodiolus platifrons methanotrophic gill symbiont]|uniref:IS66 family insertion sequence element accessory protein TnpB n=1 Tax=Bathymodiolus platifrons methanotrophic gill symbiont TaxID=113268 RepID=UPI001C8D9D3C|nr:IS66 family insertion sequence element accessory protein TnpB [Bathymodiolus platifrons methanotrophic gill symbiont]
MINGLSVNYVYLATGVTDMRKSINGLSLIVSEQFGHDPFNGSVFVFCNRSRDKLKILYWECNGFWLYYRRLDKGKFKWPAELNERKRQLNHTFKTNLKNGRLLLPINSGGINEPISK